MSRLGENSHILYCDGDQGIPEAILDRNGSVVLGLCIRCGAGESELAGPCLSYSAVRVLAERRRQILDEGWSATHDDAYGRGELARAALSYIKAALSPNGRRNIEGLVHWPWDLRWWKPSTPQRDLVKAAALLIAELERLERRQESRAD
jgi:hypothetical protein